MLRARDIKTNDTQILLLRRSLMTENSGTDMQETNNIQSLCLTGGLHRKIEKWFYQMAI